jgi:hypothetical protein
MARNLAVLRILVGVVSYFAPRLGGRLFGLDVAGNPQAPYLARLFGARDFALAIGTLQSSGSAQKQWLQLGLLCDAADTGAALLGKRDGSLPKGTAILVGAVAASAVVMGAKAIGEADQDPSSSA